VYGRELISVTLGMSRCLRALVRVPVLASRLFFASWRLGVSLFLRRLGVNRFLRTLG
jgi:hypothetical protein